MRRLHLAVFLFAAIFSAGAALAQSTWIQISAHPSLNAAQAQVSAFAARLQGVAGFALNGGWYAVAIGPYSEADARARLLAMRASGQIPTDSFLVDGTVFRQQFFPVGATALTAPAPTAPEAGNGAADPATASAEAAAAPLPEPPDETPAEARRSERGLSRDERAELQVALQWFGFYSSAIDAAFGPGTRTAMAAYQASIGVQPSGVLTTRQRARLLSDYEAELATIGLETVRDEVAGIEIELPLGMVAFDRYDPPFAHYPARGDSGVQVLLISQAGDAATLLGLYDIMQTLEVVPMEGERQQRRDEFVLTGADASITSYTYAKVVDGTVKGFTLIWPAGNDRRRELVLNRMRESFTPIEGTVLPEAYGEGALEQSVDLLSGLKIRRPDRSRSGFFIDGSGSVLTTAGAVAECKRVTLDETYEVEVAAIDEASGFALVRPKDPLSPLGYAKFRMSTPRLQSEVAVAGYSFDGLLSAPTMTFGRLADIRGLQGEEHVNRLALSATESDAGGPVFDSTGSVMGMLLAPVRAPGKRLPEGVSFAADTKALAGFLAAAGYDPMTDGSGAALSPEELTEIAADVTVLVSCWN